MTEGLRVIASGSVKWVVSIAMRVAFRKIAPVRLPGSRKQPVVETN
jgi:hypothetical protein